MRRSLRLLTCFCLSLCVAAPAVSGHLADCSSALDRLATAARDASDASDTADNAEDEVESAKSMYELCSEDCSFEKQRYENAIDEYRQALNELTSALDDVESAIRNVSNSCQ